MDNECVEGVNELMNTGYNGKAVIDSVVEGEDLEDGSEYGYGFWMRFLTRYPVPLYEGKKAPWYFVSRLTKNNPYKNVGLGDRVLAIF